jgi:CDP-paratose 2-epimerase
MIEAIKLTEEIAERELQWELLDEARIGDHRWWISDVQPFIDDYPEWSVTYGTEEILREIYELNAERWVTA